MTDMTAGALTTDDLGRFVRDRDRDRYLSALLAGEPVRRDLLAFAALNAELDLVHAKVSDPTLGAIRLQWWREQISQARAGNGSDTPITRALTIALIRCRKPQDVAQALTGLVDARQFDISRQAMRDEQELAAYLAKTSGALFALSCHASGIAVDRDIERIVGDAGQAYGTAVLLYHLPRYLSHGIVHVPHSVLTRHGLDLTVAEMGADRERALAVLSELADMARAHLQRAGAALRDRPGQVRAAFRPLAMTVPYLGAALAPGRDPLREMRPIGPLTRVWRIWRGRDNPV